MSRIGRAPITVPDKVKVELSGCDVKVTGPKGSLEKTFHPSMKIKIDKGGNKTEYCFYDPETYYEIKNVQVEQVDGKEVETATVYSNFQKQDGILFPFTMQQANPMMGNSTITIPAVSLNPTVDDKIFEMPAKK